MSGKQPFKRSSVGCRGGPAGRLLVPARGHGRQTAPSLLRHSHPDIQDDGGGVRQSKGRAAVAEGNGQVMPQAVGAQIHHKALGGGGHAGQVAEGDGRSALGGDGDLADLTGAVLVHVGCAQLGLHAGRQARLQRFQALLGGLGVLDGLENLGRLAGLAGLALGGVGDIRGLGLRAAKGAGDRRPRRHHHACSQSGRRHCRKDLFHITYLHCCSIYRERSRGRSHSRLDNPCSSSSSDNSGDNTRWSDCLRQRG